MNIRFSNLRNLNRTLLYEYQFLMFTATFFQRLQFQYLLILFTRESSCSSHKIRWKLTDGCSESLQTLRLK